MSQYEFVKIRPNIWQIAEDEGVYATLVMGEKLAILWDTGYGKRNIRKFVEDHVKTPYIVMNSHGHPDHCMGNHFFEEVYASSEDIDVIRFYTYDEVKEYPTYQIHPVTEGTGFDLGGLHGKIIDMSGHTKGSIGLLLEEEKLLLSGDAVNESLWVFNYGALTVSHIEKMIERVIKLPFDTYLCGHSNHETKKSCLQAHLKNIANLQVKDETKEVIFGDETYKSFYEGEEGKSIIVFRKDLIG